MLMQESVNCFIMIISCRINSLPCQALFASAGGSLLTPSGISFSGSFHRSGKAVASLTVSLVILIPMRHVANIYLWNEHQCRFYRRALSGNTRSVTQ